eukprot:7956890-Pyramimonas_sp.AAC.1
MASGGQLRLCVSGPSHAGVAVPALGVVDRTRGLRRPLRGNANEASGGEQGNVPPHLVGASSGSPLAPLLLRGRAIAT